MKEKHNKNILVINFIGSDQRRRGIFRPQIFASSTLAFSNINDGNYIPISTGIYIGLP